MMRASANEDTESTTFAVAKQGAKVCTRRGASSKAALIVLVLTALAPCGWARTDFDIVQAPGGIPITVVGTNAATSFGTLNALGIGTPAAGVTVIPLSNGSLYLTTYGLFVHGGLPAGHNAIVTGYVSANFVHPAALIVQSCPVTSTCNASGQFSSMSITAGAQTAVAPAPGIPKGNTATAGLAVFVPDNNGGSSFSGTDSAAITFTMIDSTNGNVIGTETLNLNTPSETLQSAIRLTLGAATGGLTILPSTDYAIDFGNVNGLGIGPRAGLTVTSVSGGVVYATPYLLQPAFSDQSSTTATINVALAVNFAHPTVLQLKDASTVSGPFTQITSTPLTIANAAADRSIIPRDLGLFVSNGNGATAFAGTDSAALTFTMTVP